MNSLINNLIERGYLKSSHIIDAFANIERIEFVPKELESQANTNIPLPIGYGQTISQPMTVAIMLELLDPQKGQNILDIGCGSGWTTALLAHIVGKTGKVTGVERIKELAEISQQNVNKYKFIDEGIVEIYNADGSLGLEKNAPYDRILVSAMAEEVPQALKNQLKVGGKMVIPVHNAIWYLEKKSPEEFYKEEFSGFTFVPLVVKG